MAIGEVSSRVGLDSITDSMDVNLSKLWDSEGQGNLACCSPWDCKESGTIQGLQRTKSTFYLSLHLQILLQEARTSNSPGRQRPAVGINLVCSKKSKKAGELELKEHRGEWQERGSIILEGS